MNMRLVTLFVVGVSIFSLGTAFASYPTVELEFKEFLSKDWKVVSIHTNAEAPYGWELDPKNPGLAVHLEGPAEIEVYGKVFHEGVTLCFMPLEYVPGKMQLVQFPAGGLLGKTDKFQLFVHVWPDSKTWKNCREDIKKHFLMKKPIEQPAPATPTILPSLP